MQRKDEYELDEFYGKGLDQILHVLLSLDMFSIQIVDKETRLSAEDELEHFRREKNKKFEYIT